MAIRTISTTITMPTIAILFRFRRRHAYHQREREAPPFPSGVVCPVSSSSTTAGVSIATSVVCGFSLGIDALWIMERVDGADRIVRLRQPDPRVEEGVEDVDQEVDDHEHHRREDDDSLDDRVVDRGDRVEGEEADTRPVEDVL